MNASLNVHIFISVNIMTKNYDDIILLGQNQSITHFLKATIK